MSRDKSKLNLLREEQKALPPGHIRKKEIDNKIKQEYQKCHEQVEGLFKNLPPRIRKKARTLSIKQVVTFYTYAACFLKVRPVKVFCTGCSRYAGGEYKSRRISFPEYTKEVGVQTITAIHEFAHHVCQEEGLWRGGSHGEEFCWAQEVVFEAFEEWWLGREKKDDPFREL